MKYRLGLDIGTHSIGWAIVALDDANPPKPASLVRIGSRIFPDGRDPQSGESLAVNRREPRSQRRRRDRFLRRQQAFLDHLIRYGLLPQGEKARKELQPRDPYTLRKKGLDGALLLHELGRALFHLNQRRGFKSNRKADRKAGESGKIKQAADRFAAEELSRYRTVGEALYHRLAEGKGSRARLQGSGVKAAYDFYVTREMIGDEFDALWAKQQSYHPEQLHDQARATLRDILLRQRPLKSPPVGKCWLEPNEARAPLALPSSQRFRLYQELNHLRLIDLSTGEERPLSRRERDNLASYLASRAKAKYQALRQRLFGKENRDAFVFTIEQGGLRKELYGDTSAHRLAHKKGFGKAWFDLPPAEQDAIVERLLETEEEAALTDWLKQRHGLDQAAADYLAGVPLDEGHLRFGRTAIGRVLPHLIEGWNQAEDQPLTYDQAVKAADYEDHRAAAANALLERLPYYGEILWRHTQEMSNATDSDEKEYGRITNPTVHIGLNQLRKLVNAVIDRYGPPAQISVELARELKLSREQKRRVNRDNVENRERNELLNKELIEEWKQRPTAANRLRLRLFKELGPLAPRCPYTGELIKPTLLFSNHYQVDHILPFSKTLDDSYNNKILATREGNAAKGNRDPYSYAAETPGVDREAVQARAEALPYEKRKRFKEDAYTKWLGNFDEFAGEDGKGFLARQLTDTAYLSRVSRHYLQSVCRRVDVTPGRLTALLRGKWGLNGLLNEGNRKNRDDHRHHAIDAAVVAVTDRGLLQRIATRAGRAESRGDERIFADLDREMPWPDFRQALEKALTRCVVSHKPDHNPQSQLHEETAYGIVDGPTDKGVYTARHRVSLASLKGPKDLALLESARLARMLEKQLAGLDGKAFQARLAELQGREDYPNKVRLLRKISGVTVPLRGTAISPDPRRRPACPAKLYKGGANYCYELFFNEKGRWDGALITSFTANQPAYRAFMGSDKQFRQKTFNGMPLLMRLIRDDLIAIEESPGKRRIMRIVLLTEGKVVMAEHFEANADARNRDKQSPFKYLTKSPDKLRKLRARRVFVDLLGRVKDPGFKG
ncbi:MAG: type II CRISPR RNA-guided endonuclease Cas9 [Candidatus Thiodiazotropha endolucinida]